MSILVQRFAIFVSTLALPLAALADITDQTVTLAANQTLNLDTGTVGASGGDIGWDGSNIQFQGSAIGTVMKGFMGLANFNVIQESLLAVLQITPNALAAKPILVSSLPAQSILCVYTNGKNLAKVLIVSASSRSLSLEFTTYIINGGGGGTPGGPSIRSVNPVLNAASYAYANLPNGGIAQGSFMAIFGSNLGPKTSPALSLPLQTNLGGVTVTVSAGGKNFDAIPLYVGPTQINAILPSKTTVGPATVTVNYNGTSNAASFTVTDRSVGLIALNSAGSGPGIITDGKYHLYNVTSSAAHAGDTSILWATGLGGVSNDTIVPNFGPMNVPGLEVYVGLQKATVQYSGRGCCAGEDQINIVIPQGVTGCHVPVAVQLKNSAGKSVVSNFVTMPIADAGQQVCSDALSSTTSIDLSGLPKSGDVSFGFIELSRLTTETTTPALAEAGQAAPRATTTTSTEDVGTAVFFKYTVQQLQYATNPFGAYTIGACTVYKYSGQGGGYTDPIRSTPLDAGKQIDLNGPKGAMTLPLVAGAPGIYDATLGGNTGTKTLPPYLDPGDYTADNGTGGKDVGAFTAKITRPQPLVWTNEDSVNTVVEANGQLITWTGGNPDGTVEIYGSSFLLGTQPDGSDTVGASFVCIVPDSPQQFTIPAVVLLSLPPSANNSAGGVNIPTGSMLVQSNLSVPFTAPGLNYSFISTSDASDKSVTYQ